MKLVEHNFKKQKGRRPETRFEATAAEFLVLGHLLRLRIESHKSYTNMRGYDLLAINADQRTVARIQVKGRSHVRASGFIIGNFENDFVVFAKLNSRGRKRDHQNLPQEFFIFPTAKVESALRKGKVSKVYISDIENHEQYRNAWHLIAEFLAQKVGRSR